MKREEELEFVFKQTPLQEKEEIGGIKYISFKNQSGKTCFCPLELVPDDIVKDLLKKYRS